MERQTMIAKLEESLVRIVASEPGHNDLTVARNNLRLVLDGLRAEGDERIRLREGGRRVDLSF